MSRLLTTFQRTLRGKFFKIIIEENLKLCISKKVLVIFIKVEDNEYSPTIFLDVVQLEESSNNAGFDKRYLQNNLIAFCSDGARVMLGKTFGGNTRMKRNFLYCYLALIEPSLATY